MKWDRVWGGIAIGVARGHSGAIAAPPSQESKTARAPKTETIEKWALNDIYGQMRFLGSWCVQNAFAVGAPP